MHVGRPEILILYRASPGLKSHGARGTMIRIAVCGGAQAPTGLESALRRDPEFRVIAFRDSLDEFLAQTAGHDLDVVLLALSQEHDIRRVRKLAIWAPGAKIVLWADAIPEELV